MRHSLFYRVGTTKACVYAENYLKDQGILFSDTIVPQVTDLLLDVPSFKEEGILRNGKALANLLKNFSAAPFIWGGRLPSTLKGFDLLENPAYVTENAAITADCALKLASPSLQTTWKDSKVLVIGWGRIGKSLCKMLKALGAQVTVCARKEPDRALLSSFGYQVIEPKDLNGAGYHVIFNTAPATVMDEDSLSDCPIPMDLASQEGLKGDHVIRARGLPGVYAPVSSGKLIAATILKNLRGE